MPTVVVLQLPSYTAFVLQVTRCQLALRAVLLGSVQTDVNMHPDTGLRACTCLRNQHQASSALLPRVSVLCLLLEPLRVLRKGGDMGSCVIPAIAAGVSERSTEETSQAETQSYKDDLETQKENYFHTSHILGWTGFIDVSHTHNIHLRPSIQ